MVERSVGHMPEANIPNPDPSAATVDMIRREFAMLEQRVAIHIGRIDKATELFQENLTRVPTDVQKAVGHLESLHDEKFAGVNIKFVSIETQFAERDVRAGKVEQAQKEAAAATSEAAKVGVAAALQAQKEAAAASYDAQREAGAKTEATTSKLIEALQTLLGATNTGFNEKVSAVNSRLDRIETGLSTRTAGNGQLVSLVAVAIAGVAAVISAYSVIRG